MESKDIKKLKEGDLLKDAESGSIFKVIAIDLKTGDDCPLRVELVESHRKFNTSNWAPINETLYEPGNQAWLFVNKSTMNWGIEIDDDEYVDPRTVLTCEDLELL